MMNIRKYIFLILIISASHNPIFAQTEDGGQAGAFLRIGVGARALSMGSAFTAVANDPSAGFWNAAGLINLEFPEIIGTYSVLSLDRSYNYAGIGLPFSERLYFAFNWIGLGVDQIEGRSAEGRFTDYFKNQEQAYIMSFGIKLHKNIGIGFSSKYLSHTLSDNQSSGYGFDASAYIKPFSFLSFGYQVQDISSKVRWDTESKLEEKFPQCQRIAFCLSPFKNNTLITMDIENTANQKSKLHAGLEVPVLSFFGIRAGYSHNKMLGGAYLLLPIENKQLILDYCIGEDPIDQTKSHRVSLRLRMARDEVDINPPKPIDPNKLNGALKILFEQPDAVISKLVPNYPKYALVSCGIKQGYRNGMKFHIYRAETNIGLDEKDNIIQIGEVHIVKAKDTMSAVIVDWVKEGFRLQVGDYLFLVDKSFSVIK